MKVSVSILSSKKRIKAVKKLNNTNMDYLHIDVMDGIFVKNKQFSIRKINRISKISKRKLDIHLMVDNPVEYINKLNLDNVKYITIHYEIDKDIKELINLIKSKKVKVGLSIKPNTGYLELVPYLNDIDLILIMSVEPGLGGQEFINSVLDKAKELSKLKKVDTLMEIDGGVNNMNIDLIKESFIDIVVAGSYIINNDDYQKQIDSLR